MHVVVLAYGPTEVTKKAVRRARSLKSPGHRVIVVAASPAGTASIEKLKPEDKVPSLGGAGLIEAFAGLGEAPTLLIHDDTVITSRSVAALQAEFDTGTRYVVPYSNDREVSPFVGSLPAGAAAEKTLDQLPSPTQTIPAETLRPSCILAAATDLTSLLVEPIVDPVVIVRGAEGGFKAAANTLAAHTGACADRMVTADANDRPLLVAALIVRNEEAMLPECLASLQGVVDRIEVCDTGSTDRTIEIARAAGAHVTEREWPDNFAVARNYVLDACRDTRYILTIDADERLHCDDPKAVRRHLATYSAEYPALSIGVTNVAPDGSETTQFYSVRLFAAEGTEYRGAIHEVVHRKGEEDPLAGPHFTGLQLRHFGYADEIVANRDKVQRNLELAEAEYRDNPRPQSAVHLARTLAHAKADPQRILALLEEARAQTAQTQPTALAQILDLMADQYVNLGDDESVFELSREALLLVPADDTAAAQLAKAADRLGRLDELIEIADSIAGNHSVRPAHQVDSSRAIFRSALVAAHARTNDCERAVAEAFGLLSDYPAGFAAWDPLVDSLAATYGAAAVELLAPLAAKAPDGTFLEPIIRAFPSATFANFCVAYRASGGSVAEVTRVGLLAAAIAGEEDIFRALAAHASDLAPEERSALADRISSSGRPDLADLLRSAPVAAIA